MTFLAWVLAVNLYGQNPAFVRYTVNDGLPSNEVYDAYQDKEGHIWFATDHGLSKFDGYTFKNYSMRDGLSDNTVFEFKEDKYGMVWMRCLNGTLSLMHKGKFFSYPHNDILRQANQERFLANFDIDDQNRMYFTTFRQAKTMVLDLYSGKIDSIDFPAGNYGALLQTQNPMHRIAAISNLQDPKKVETGEVICRPNIRYWGLGKQRNSHSSNGRNLNFSIGRDVDVGLFGALIYRIEECQVKCFKDIPIGLIGMYKDNREQTWLLKSNGISLLDAHLQESNKLFENEFCLGMLQDRSGNYWICTNNGVLLVRNMNNRVYQEVNGRKMTQVTRLRLLDSTLYVLHENTQIESAEIRGKNWLWRTESYLPKNAHFCRDFIPFRVQNRPKLFYSIRELIESNAIASSDSISANFPWQFRLHNDRLLVSTNLGFQVLELKAAQTRLSWQFQNIGRVCSAILQDSSGTIWIGTTKGLLVCDGHEVKAFHPENKLFKARITDLALMEDGCLAIATRGEGLLLHKNGKTIQIDEGKYQPSNMINHLFLGASGLWICSNVGLSLLPRHNGNSILQLNSPIRNFTILDGLPSNKVNDVLEFDGKIYAATDNGLVVFDHQMSGNAMPKTKIETVKADDRLISRTDKLSTEEDNLQFQFGGEKLMGMGTMCYHYKLEGYDPAWRTTKENTVQYYNLPPGNYDFKVSAGYGLMLKNTSNTDHWQVNLPYKFYERNEFRIAAAFATLILFIFIVRLFYIGRQRRLRSEIIRAKAEIKALRSQMRPHFIFNALNSIQELILINDSQTAQTHLAKFAKLMRKVLEASNHEEIAVSKEIEIIMSYLELEKLRFGEQFHFEIELQEGVAWTALKIPPMLLQPLLENAIWHGLSRQKAKPSLWIRFKQLGDGLLLCEIEDNGIGRKAASQVPPRHDGPSMGLNNILDRIALLNSARPGTIRLSIIDLEKDGQSKGTLAKLHVAQTGYEPK